MMQAKDGRLEVLFDRFKEDYLFYFSRLLNKVLVEPEMLQIMLTSKCNIRCKICGVWQQSFERELGIKEVKNMVDEAIDMGIKTIYFTGGEALLRPDVFEIIDYASRPGIITTINTNGSLVTEDMAKKIVRSKLRNISFSIDSSTSEFHDSIRGKGVFEKAMRGLAYINYYRKQYKREYDDGEGQRLDIGMVSVLTNRGVNDLLGLIDLAKRVKCCYIALQPLIDNTNLLATDIDNDFWIGKEDIPKLQSAFEKLAEIKDKALAEGLYIDYMPQKTIQHFKRERKVNTCFAGFSRIFVSPQGDISFVCFESFGNIKQVSLREAWHSDKAYLTRKRIKACMSNCTQFCAERPRSEDLRKIHAQLEKEIEFLAPLEKENVYKRERVFLQSMKNAINLSEGLERDHRTSALTSLGSIINSIGDKL